MTVRTTPQRKPRPKKTHLVETGFAAADVLRAATVTGAAGTRAVSGEGGG